MSTLAVVVACGKEEQITSGTDTAFLSLGSRPVWIMKAQGCFFGTRIDPNVSLM